MLNAVHMRMRRIKMFYIVRCPECGDSEIEELDDVNFRGFKCCECDYTFSASEAKFDEITFYEIR
jgi:transposase-like protein